LFNIAYSTSDIENELSLLPNLKEIRINLSKENSNKKDLFVIPNLRGFRFVILCSGRLNTSDISSSHLSWEEIR